MRFRIAITALGLAGLLAAAGCSTVSSSAPEATKVSKVEIFDKAYEPVTDAGFALPAIPINRVKPEFRRQIVDYDGDERPGTIVVKTRERHLYYCLLYTSPSPRD